MEELTLYKSEFFGSINCDIWKDKNSSILMTRKQIGEALEYSDPQKAIDKLHNRHKDRLDQFSVTTSLVGTDGKVYNTTLYTHKGVFELCRWSKQAKADLFMDWVWDIIENVMEEQLSIYRQLTQAENCLTMNQVAKSIKACGRNKLFLFLRNEEILMSTKKNWNLPYQQYIKQGYFDVILIPQLIKGEIEDVPTCVVTPKGVEYIIKLLKKKDLLKQAN